MPSRICEKRCLRRPPKRSGKGGPIVNHPPTADPNDPAEQRWNERRKERQAGIDQAQKLYQQGLLQRASARKMGLNRRTVKKLVT